MNTDGAAGAPNESKPSAPLKGPNGMRFGDSGNFYLAEIGAAQIDGIAMAGDVATVPPPRTGSRDAPTPKCGDQRGQDDQGRRGQVLENRWNHGSGLSGRTRRALHDQEVDCFAKGNANPFRVSG